MSAELVFDAPKPPKCKHCGYIRGEHRAKTYQCPAKWSRGRAGFTHYLETVFEEKAKRGAA
jgi:predicted Zn-ribbon and HTH transcriptional regulator